MPVRTSSGLPDSAICTDSEQDSFLQGGFARLSHFRSPIQREYFSELEELSEQFYAEAWANGRQGYAWPLDPLHSWSRIWEYPFIAAQLAKLPRGNSNPKVLDIGAAATFFSFYLLRQRYCLMNLDYDASMPSHFAYIYERVRNILSCPSRPPYLVADARNTQLPDGSFDIALSISVLEHIPDWPRAIEEVRRLLKTGGYFLLTFDAQLDGKGEGHSEGDIAQLLELLGQGWIPLTSLNTGLPSDLLHMKNSPAPPEKHPKRSLFRLPMAVARNLYQYRRLRRPRVPCENICVFGGVWQKR